METQGNHGAALTGERLFHNECVNRRFGSALTLLLGNVLNPLELFWKRHAPTFSRSAVPQVAFQKKKQERQREGTVTQTLTFSCFCLCVPANPGVDTETVLTHRPAPLRGWRYGLHEFHETSLLLWRHPSQLQAGHFWYSTTSKRGPQMQAFWASVSSSLLTNPRSVWFLCSQRWKKPSLHWWQMTWGPRFCGTASYRHLWVGKSIWTTVTFALLSLYLALNAAYPFFLTGMLTITDFINILHCYYKSPMVSVYMHQFKTSMHHWG